MSARVLAGDLRAAAARDPAKTAVVAQDGRLGYGELDAAADRVARGLRALGVARGDRVAIVMPNGAALAQALYGVLRAGAAITPLNPTMKEDKLARVLAHSEAAAVICDDGRAAVAGAAAARAGAIPVVADVASLDGDGEPAPEPPLDVDLAALMYTSGSTGEPKGVMVTHANMAFAAGSIVEYLAMGPDDRILCVLPLSFNYGLYQLLTCVRVGATVVLEPGLGFPGRIAGLLEEERITGLPGVPTVFGVLVGLDGLGERELPHLRFLTNAGAALPEVQVAHLRGTFPGARLFSMYGQTECTRVCYLPPEQLDVRPTSVGIPIPGTEAWVEDEDGRAAAAGEVGELMVRGSHVMKGYWRDPRATAVKLRPGRWPWERVLATGDLFRRDAEGYLYFVARRDDLIKSRGEKVAPREVEEALHAVPGVREAAVVGVPDALLGEAVHAHVVLAEGSPLGEADLRRACAERLEAHMVPQRVAIHAALPRTPNGKLDRRALAAG